MSRWRSLLIRVLAYRVIVCDAFGLILTEANLWRGKARSPRRTSGKPRLTWARSKIFFEAGREAIKLKVEVVRLKAKELLERWIRWGKAAPLRASARGRAACD